MQPGDYGHHSWCANTSSPVPQFLPRYFRIFLYASAIYERACFPRALPVEYVTTNRSFKIIDKTQSA